MKIKKFQSEYDNDTLVIIVEVPSIQIIKYEYYPNLVILPVDNNEHQRIDDVSTDRISYDIRSVETMAFAL